MSGIMERRNSRENVDGKTLKLVYARTLSTAFSSGLSAPFFGLFEARLGASPAELGAFHSMLNLFSNIAQLLWGYLSDKFMRKKLIVFLSTLTSSLIFILILSSKTPLDFIAYASLQAIIASAGQPAWLALVGNLAPPSYVGTLASTLNLWNEVGVLASTFAAGVLAEFSADGLGEFTLPFLLALAFGILASLLVIPIPEVRVKSGNFHLGFKFVLKDIAHNEAFLKFIAVSTAYGIFMSLAWPMFTYVVANELGLELFEIAILNVGQGIVRTLTQIYAGRLIDHYGRKPFIAYGRILLTFFTLVYAFFPDFTIILAVSMFLSIPVALLNTAILAYLIDVTPPEVRGSYTAVYNLSIGLAFSIGSMVGGIFAQLLSVFLGESEAVKLVLIASGVGRFIFGILHFKISESRRMNE